MWGENAKPLQGSDDAIPVDREGVGKPKLMVTDGPFAEAKEVVGGYAVLEAKSRAEALEATRLFLQLHQQHWPGWEGECEIRELCFLAP